MERFDSILSWYGSARPEFRSAVAHLPVERQIGQRLDARAFAELLTVVGQTAFGQVSGDGPAVGIEALDDPGATQGFEPADM